VRVKLREPGRAFPKPAPQPAAQAPRFSVFATAIAGYKTPSDITTPAPNQKQG